MKHTPEGLKHNLVSMPQFVCRRHAIMIIIEARTQNNFYDWIHFKHKTAMYFSTRLLHILMKQQPHQQPPGTCYMIWPQCHNLCVDNM